MQRDYVKSLYDCSHTNSSQFYPMDFIPLLGKHRTRDEQQTKLSTKQATIFQTESNC